ncbi:MAG: exodeoxyribonuclease VII small subunit [Desulfovibrio sp.]|nr:exodeoxyribonuclease VII small subunit [Desulfovibrio sp.]
MARLQEIVAALESGNLPLEEGMALYREGAECSRFCRQQLDKARHELSLWQDGAEQAFKLDDDQSEEGRNV